MVADFSFIAAALLILGLVAWYWVANQRWTRFLREKEPALFVDPVAQPTQWATTGPSRLRRMLKLLKSRSDDDQLELARLRVLHRAIAACILAPLALFGLPVLSAVTVTFVRTETERGGIGLGVISVAVLGAILAYWGWRLARAILRYGNGASIRASEVAVPIFGIVAAGLMAAFLAGTPVGPLR